jgi:hypothetical protein
MVAMMDKTIDCFPAMDTSLKFKRQTEAATCAYPEIQKEL